MACDQCEQVKSEARQYMKDVDKSAATRIHEADNRALVYVDSVHQWGIKQQREMMRLELENIRLVGENNYLRGKVEKSMGAPII